MRVVEAPSLPKSRWRMWKQTKKPTLNRSGKLAPAKGDATGAGPGPGKRSGPGLRLPSTRLSGRLKQDLKGLILAFGNAPDLVSRTLTVGPEPGLGVALVYLEGLVDEKLIANDILRPLSRLPRVVDEDWLRRLAEERQEQGEVMGEPDTGPEAGPVKIRPKPIGSQPAARLKSGIARTLREQTVTVGGVIEERHLWRLIHKIGSGYCVLLIDGSTTALACSTKSLPKRAVEQPVTESSVSGSHEAFGEALRQNTAILRRRIRGGRLRIEETHLGTLTHNKLALVYIDGLPSTDLLAEVRTRIGRIKIDNLQGSGNIDEFIQDDSFSPFPQILRTERPDRTVAALAAGRVAILVDGDPYALIVPVTLWHFLSAVDDYYERFGIGSFLRFIRVVAFFASLLLPALYVAVTTFHPQILPTSLILSIAAQREGVPFPAVLEALLLEAALDVLREAGVRLPRIIGPTISIVGVLVIGQAAVSAGLFSPIMVVVVAFTGIASYTTPIFSMNLAVRMIRYVIIIAAGALGFYGIFTVMSVLLIHFLALRSFGQPYLAPLGPVYLRDLKDALIRFPVWALDTRPHFMKGRDWYREARKLRPLRPHQAWKDVGRPDAPGGSRDDGHKGGDAP